MIFNKKSHFVSDATVDRKLAKVTRRYIQDARKKVRNGELDAQGLVLYLPKLDDQYGSIRSEVNTAVNTSVDILKRQYSKDYYNVEKLVGTFDNDIRRLNAAFKSVEIMMAEANIPIDERESEPVTYTELFDRFKKLELVEE